LFFFILISLSNLSIDFNLIIGGLLIIFVNIFSDFSDFSDFSSDSKLSDSSISSEVIEESYFLDVKLLFPIFLCSLESFLDASSIISSTSLLFTVDLVNTSLVFDIKLLLSLF